MNKNKLGNQTIAVSQILIMVVGIFAIGYVLGSEIKEVSAAESVENLMTANLDANLKVPNTPVTTSTPTSFSPRLKGVETSSWEGNTKLYEYSSGYQIPDGTTITQGNVVVNGKTLSAGADASYTVNDIGNNQWEVLDAEGNVIETTTTQPTIAEGGTAMGTQYEAGSWYGTGTVLGALGRGVIWAGVVFGIVALVDALAPDSWQSYTNALMYALPAGTFVGGSLFVMLGKGGSLFKQGLSSRTAFWDINYGQLIGVGIGVAVAVGVFLMMYEETEQEMVTFTCYPWDAPLGGSNCEKCNTLELPCSEYQCKSLGQACELQNANTESPLCAWVSRGDVIAPVMTLWQDVLTAGLKYTPTTASTPEDKGVKIENSLKESKCIDAYTPLTFGIQTDEPAKCMLDIISKQNFSDMSYPFGSSLYIYNHSYTMSIPGAESNENVTLKNGGEFQLYVRCQDANGNYNVGNFVFKFCVDDSPDTTAPQILGTNLINNMPIAYNTSKVDIELYTNEPADCKWDSLDKGEYDKMDNTMTCSRTAIEMNADMVYTCKGTLTGIKSGVGVENNYFFKCKDKPTATTDRITNAENYKFTILGTQPLILGEIGPNETIKDNTNPVKVTLTAETSAGYKDGESTCYYSFTGRQADYEAFFNSGSYTHSQDLSLVPAKYNISLKCVDLGGNSVYGLINFTVESDGDSPKIIRFYKDGLNLRTITNEYGECVYSTNDCTYQFSDGIAMTTVDDTNQYTSWINDQTYYIRCKDKYGNQPDAGTCTLIVGSYEEI